MKFREEFFWSFLPTLGATLDHDLTVGFAWDAFIRELPRLTVVEELIHLDASRWWVGKFGLVLPCFGLFLPRPYVRWFLFPSMSFPNLTPDNPNPLNMKDCTHGIQSCHCHQRGSCPHLCYATIPQAPTQTMVCTVSDSDSLLTLLHQIDKHHNMLTWVKKTGAGWSWVSLSFWVKGGGGDQGIFKGPGLSSCWVSCELCVSVHVRVSTCKQQSCLLFSSYACTGVPDDWLHDHWPDPLDPQTLSSTVARGASNQGLLLHFAHPV